MVHTCFWYVFCSERMINYPVVEVEISSVYLRLKRMVEVVMDGEMVLLVSIEISPSHPRLDFISRKSMFSKQI